MKSLWSVNDLAFRIGIPRARLEAVAADLRPHYREWPLVDKKNPAKIRMIRSPRAELKQIQRLLVQRVLSAIPLDAGVHGGIRGRSPRSNAQPHLAQPYVVTLDVREFFQHVRHEIVYDLFRSEIGFGREVARLLTRLMTYQDELPRGAPSSLAVANLVLSVPVDQALSRAVLQTSDCFTRFVDDFALSGSNPRPLINEVARMLSRRRLPMYRARARFQSKPKLKIRSGAQPQEVTGLLVNRRGSPSISRSRRDRVRAALHALPPPATPQHSRAVQSVRGRIRYVAGFNPGSGRRLQRDLESALSSAPLRHDVQEHRQIEGR
jgi:hypothetical protein